MATVVDTYKNEDGHTINVYESGAQYNLTTKRLAQPASHTVYNPETSMQGVERRRELKREAVARGAAKVLERSGEWEAPNNLDVVEAVSEAVMLKALNPDNPKQVDAARFILQESGMAEIQPSSSVSPSNFAAASAFGTEIARQFAQIISDVMAQQGKPANQVIDAE